MHRLHSKSAIFRFRLVALMLCVKWVLGITSLGMLAYSIVIHDNPLTIKALGGLFLTLILMICVWIAGLRARCPLCLTPVLARKHCTKHRNAKAFLGSHRLRVALAILLKNSFRCPYCHEPTAMEVRDRTHYRSYSRG